MTALINAIAKRLGGLPPDPDKLNGGRSDSALAAIAAFEHVANTAREDSLADLLCNLMHWCDREGTDFDTELTRGRGNYLAETDPDLDF